MDFERKSLELMAAVALRIHSDVVATTVGNLNNNEKIMMLFGKFTFNFAFFVGGRWDYTCTKEPLHLTNSENIQVFWIITQHYHMCIISKISIFYYYFQY